MTFETLETRNLMSATIEAIKPAGTPSVVA